MANRIAETTRGAWLDGTTASPWGLEGPLRARLRARFCLSGWPWPEADMLARDLLSEAFVAAGATDRPSWEEGQREWTVRPGTLIERTRCANCHIKLPEGRPKFCSDLCQNAAYLRIWRIKTAREGEAVAWI